MKRTFTKWLTAVFAAVLVLTLMGCRDDEKDDNVQREFNDLMFLGKNVKLIDQTGNAKDLKARGIWQKVQDGLSASSVDPGDAIGLKFDAIHATNNFAIVITSGVDYPNGYAVDGHEILFRENQLSGYGSEDFAFFLEGAIYDGMTVAKGMRDASCFAGDAYWWCV